MTDKAAQKMYRVGYLRYQRKKLGEAEVIFEKVIDEFPESPEATRSKNLLKKIGERKDTQSPGDFCTAVVLEGIEIPFWSLAGFIIKVTLAAVPAAIVVAIFYFLMGVLLAVFGLSGLL